MSDSSTGGQILPASADVTDDRDLDAIFSPIVGGIMGIPKVYPRWQAISPHQPEANVNWAAVGVMTVSSRGYPSRVHDSTGQGQEILTIQEEIELLVSVYGPNSAQKAALLRDGLMIAQNRESLTLLGIAYVRADEIRRVPSLINQGWVNRADIMLRFRRTVTRTYPVLNLLSAQGVVETPAEAQPFVTETSS